MTDNNVQGKSWLDTLINTNLVSNFLKNKGLLRGLSICGGILFVFFISTVITDKEIFIPDDLSPIAKSIQKVKKVPDAFKRERLIQTEAESLKLSSDDYRKLFEALKSDSDILPDVRTDSSFLSLVVWFYQDLSRSQRLKLMGGWIWWMFGTLPHLTILYVGWKYLDEIPQRERQAEDQKRQAKLDAWQVVAAASGHKFSRARIIALEDLVKHGESLQGLYLEEGVDLSGINFENANLNNAELKGVNFRGANLKGADLRKANLENADLGVLNTQDPKHRQVTNLEGADLSSADLEGANLSSANLQGAKLYFVNLGNAKLYKANLALAVFSDGSLNMADLSYAVLNGANLSIMMLKGANLSNTKLQGATISFSNFDAANLYKADLDGSKLEHTSFTLANLSAASLKNVNFCLVDLKSANLKHANFENAKNLSKNQLKDSYLCDTKLSTELEDLSNHNCENLQEWDINHEEQLQKIEEEHKKYREKLKQQKEQNTK